jgi:hypothetical protein
MDHFRPLLAVARLKHSKALCGYCGITSGSDIFYLILSIGEQLENVVYEDRVAILFRLLHC